MFHIQLEFEKVLQEFLFHFLNVCDRLAKLFPNVTSVRIYISIRRQDRKSTSSPTVGTLNWCVYVFETIRTELLLTKNNDLKLFMPKCIFLHNVFWLASPLSKSLIPFLHPSSYFNCVCHLNNDVYV